jgi:hypothetical protein
VPTAATDDMTQAAEVDAIASVRGAREVGNAGGIEIGCNWNCDGAAAPMSPNAPQRWTMGLCERELVTVGVGSATG